MIPGICRYLVIMGCLAVAGMSIADEVSTRRYPLADRGTLVLSVPSSWKQDVRQPPNDLPPAIVFTPSSGAAFHIQLTIIYPLKQGMALPSVPDIKASVQVAADRAGMQSVEQQIPLQHLKGPASEGYYFRVTDKAPKPGEYTYMIQGMTRAGGVVPTFTILTNDGASQFVSGALAMIKSARFIERKQ